MGYGKRAIELLKQYYEMKLPSIDEIPESVQEIENVVDDNVGLLEECIEPRKTLPPLLLKLSERPPEKLNYLGVSYGLTEPLLKFWKRAQFVPTYLRQTTNDLTGEHSCIMLYVLNSDEEMTPDKDWLLAYWADFRKRFLSLLSYQFSSFTPAISLGILVNKTRKLDAKGIRFL